MKLNGSEAVYSTSYQDVETNEYSSLSNQLESSVSFIQWCLCLIPILNINKKYYTCLLELNNKSLLKWSNVNSVLEAFKTSQSSYKNIQTFPFFVSLTSWWMVTHLLIHTKALPSPKYLVGVSSSACTSIITYPPTQRLRTCITLW